MLLAFRGGAGHARPLSFVVSVAIIITACTAQRSPRREDTESRPDAPDPVEDGAPAAGGAGGEGGVAADDRGSGAAEAGQPTAAPPMTPIGAETPVDDPGLDDDADEAPVDEPPDEHGNDDEPPTDDDSLGLPCDVQNLLTTRCQSCHSRPPSAGASVSLLTYADLTAPSNSRSSLTVAARSLQRMKDSLAPMPPAPATLATGAELGALAAWLDAGLPPGRCDPDPGSDPYAASPTCTSGGYWTALDSGTPWMNPGLPCLECHRQNPNHAPLFTVAGTVFPTAHEPDRCFGVPATTGASVVITDANGQTLPPIEVVSGGNFGAILNGLASPYRAKVVVGENERIMLSPQTNGDCNACHTQIGAEGARGRIIAP
jgi:hypothetical protein